MSSDRETGEIDSTRDGGSFAPSRLAHATTWRLIFLGLQGTGSVVLFSALGHALPKRAFAATAVAQGVIVLAQSIGDFGLSQAAVTVIPSRIAARPDAADDLVAGAALAYAWAAALAIVLSLAAVPLVPASARGAVAVSALASAASVAVAGADGLLRSRGRFREPTLLMLASEAGGFAGLPVAVATRSAVWSCTAISIGMAFGAVGAVATLVRLARRGSPEIGSFTRASVPLGLSQVAIALATRVDTLLAGAASGLVAAGTFEGCWRIYQLIQYAAGGVASAAAPFVADALGSARTADGIRLLRLLGGMLAAIGVAGGTVLYLARTPIAQLLAGSLAAPVAHALPPLVAISPLAAVGLSGFYTLIARDRRGSVLGAIVLGAALNLGLALALAPAHGARGVVFACAAGLSLMNVLLLVRLAIDLRGLAR